MATPMSRVDAVRAYLDKASTGIREATQVVQSIKGWCDETDEEVADCLRLYPIGTAARSRVLAVQQCVAEVRALLHQNGEEATDGHPRVLT